MNIDELRQALADRERHTPDIDQVRATVLAGSGGASRTRLVRAPLLLAAAVVVIAVVTTLVVVQFRASAPPATPPVTPTPEATVAPVTPVSTEPAATATGVTTAGETRPTTATTGRTGSSPAPTTGPTRSARSAESLGSTGSPTVTTGSTTGEPIAATDTVPSRGLHEPDSLYLLRTRLQRIGVEGFTGDHPWGGRAEQHARWGDRWIFGAQSQPEFGPRSFSDPEHVDDIDILGLPVEVIRSRFTGLTLYFSCDNWVYELAVAEPGPEFFSAKATELDPAIELATLFIADLACPAAGPTGG